ncbi:MAG: hypothetical protein HDS82_06685 [Bacteroidales bacterium]|nr:hypothetical protein [Bacteroidales bacterium]
MYTTESPKIDFDKYDEPRLHMERLMKAPLVDFDISIRILIPLDEAGIRTLGDLTRQTKEGLRKINLLGKLSIDKLESFLAYHRLSLAQ